MAATVRLALLVALTLFAFALMLWATEPANAVTCARGVYRAGCVGPNGGAVVHRHPYAYGHGGTACARGPNGAGCVHRRY